VDIFRKLLFHNLIALQSYQNAHHQRIKARRAYMQTQRQNRGNWLMTCFVAFGLGWSACSLLSQARPVLAMAGDGTDHSQLVNCIVSAEYNEARKVQVPVQGLVYLDYRRGKLVGTMPELRQIGQQTRVLSNFTERDLVDDFEIRPGATPNFLVSKISTGALSDGAELLVVLDSQSRQSRIYKLGFQQSGVEFKPQFDLIEKKVFDKSGNVELPKALINPINPAAFQPGGK
jgi:hypothetical protein